jgi:two-component sensor histidine kinase
MSHETVIHFPVSRERAGDPSEDEKLDAMTTELEAIAAREESLRREIDRLLSRQNNSVQEFENRLLNGLKMIANQLSLQSRAATTPEAAAQLSIVAGRIVAMGRSKPNIRDR